MTGKSARRMCLALRQNHLLGISAVPEVAAGLGYTFVLLKSSTLAAVGNDLSRRSGLRSLAGAGTPLEAAGAGQVFIIAASSNHTVALKQDGSASARA